MYSGIRKMLKMEEKIETGFLCFKKTLKTQMNGLISLHMMLIHQAVPIWLTKLSGAY